MVDKGRSKSSQSGDDGVSERVEERRRQILDAAESVFARHGYHGARTKEIAAAAGVSEALLFKYYENKRTLFLALIRRITTTSMPETLTLVDSLAENPRSWLTAVLLDRVTMLDRNRDLFKAVTPELITDGKLRDGYVEQVVVPYFAFFSPLLPKLLESASLRDLNPRVILPAIIGATIGAYLLNTVESGPGEQISADELVSDLVSLFLEGLGRRVGRTSADESR